MYNRIFNCIFDDFSNLIMIFLFSNNRLCIRSGVFFFDCDFTDSFFSSHVVNDSNNKIKFKIYEKILTICSNMLKILSIFSSM